MVFGQSVRMDNDEPKDRLRRAMEVATGNTVATEVWAANKKALGVGKDLFISNLNGNRAISKKAAAAYGMVFGVTPGWILYGDSADAAAPSSQSHFEEVSALAAALSDADSAKLYAQLAARMPLAARPKSPAARAPKTAAKAK